MIETLDDVVGLIADKTGIYAVIPAKSMMTPLRLSASSMTVTVLALIRDESEDE